MKPGSLVICERESWPFGVNGPKKNEVCEIEAYDSRPTVEKDLYIFLVGYNEVFDLCEGRVAYNKNSFREIEFPPPLEEEIKECLTRELVEVRPYEHLSYNELYDRLMQSIRECEEILKSLKA